MVKTLLSLLHTSIIWVYIIIKTHLLFPVLFLLNANYDQIHNTTKLFNTMDRFVFKYVVDCSCNINHFKMYKNTTVLSYNFPINYCFFGLNVLIIFITNTTCKKPTSQSRSFKIRNMRKFNVKLMNSYI